MLSVPETIVGLGVIAAVGVLVVLIFFAAVASVFTADNTKVYMWVVYHNQGRYRIHYLDSMHEVTYISKSYEVNGAEFVTSSKEEACQIASMLNSVEKMNIADAKAKEWHQVKC